MARTARFIFPLGCITAAILACRGAEGPTAPANPEAARASITGVAGRRTGEDTVYTLKRTSPLINAITVSAVIGPEGGSLGIPRAGGRVVFPAGALSVPTTITMRARAGSDVAYDFEPHLIFPVPVFVQQELRGTMAELYPALIPRLGGAYFEGELEEDFVDSDALTARVRELRPGRVQRMTLTFTVNHFSGYLASSGRSPTTVAPSVE